MKNDPIKIEDLYKTKKGKYVVEEWLKTIFVSALINYDLTQEELNDEEFVHKITNQHVIKSREFSVINDYKPTLLLSADNFYVEKKYELAILMYATFIEHWINDVIIIRAEKKGLSYKASKQIVRDSNARAKLTWIWSLLENKSLNAAYIDSILKIFEYRNQFVHYKWEGKSDSLKKDDHEILDVIYSARKTIKYLNTWFTKNIVGLSDKKIKQMIRQKLKTA